MSNPGGEAPVINGTSDRPCIDGGPIASSSSTVGITSIRRLQKQEVPLVGADAVDLLDRALDQARPRPELSKYESKPRSKPCGSDRRSACSIAQERVIDCRGLLPSIPSWISSWIPALAATLLAPAGAVAAPPDANDSRPNIVLIIGDDVAWNDFGFMGSDAVRTPHLDRLAERGTVFTRAFAPVSMCGPVLRSLLTGLSPQVVSRGLERAASLQHPRPRLRDVFATLPAKLAAAGYESFQGGKFFEGGFEDGGFTHGMAIDRASAPKHLKPGRRGPAGVVRGVGGRELGRETMQPLWDFLDAHHAGPFFVWYAPMLPHVPFDAPQRFAELYAGDPPQLRGYRANLTRFDETVGQLVARLEVLGVLDETLILYLSDNGWDSSGRGETVGLGGPKGKGTLFELGVRTPLIVSLPGVVGAGRRDDRLVSLLDVHPTLIDFAGGKKTMTGGRSLAPLLNGTGDFRRDAIVGGPGEQGRRGYFLRMEKWRYISDVNAVEHLYLIENDPFEENDLAAVYPELLQKMREELLRRLPLVR